MSQPLHVLHAVTTTDVGGAETQLARLIAATPKVEARHTVVSLAAEGPLAARMREGGARVISLGLRPGPGALALGLPRLAALLRRGRPDIVQTWLYHADLLGLLAAGLAGAGPVVWGLRCSDMDLSRYPWGTRAVVRACAALSSRPAAIVANSEAGARFHRRLGYPARLMRVIANGFDTECFRPDPVAREMVRRELGMAGGELLVGHVARFDPMKDHATFLDAAVLLARPHPEARFVCLGRGMEPGNPALRRALEPPLAGRLHLLGRRDDVPRWLAAMDVHVSSSAFGEGLSNAVGEAMAAGVPNVVTDVGDSAELVGDTGCVAPPRNAAALAAAIDGLLGLPPEQLGELGAAARARIERDYSLEGMARAFLDLYRELAGREAA